MLRPYQKKALTVIYSDLKTQKTVLLSGIMGCGKTIMTVKLIERLLKENPKIQVLILMHKKELINQFNESFIKFTSIPETKIGNCCAGLNKREIKKQIIVGSIQTFINMTEHYSYADLLVVDECHRVSMTSGNQYCDLINILYKKKHSMRIFGITATPARLGDGLIYGSENDLFNKLNYAITYKELKELGFLTPLKGKIVTDKDLKKDLETVGHDTDYFLNQLCDVMTKEVHLETTIEALEKYAIDYKCICIFCCTIEHAEKLFSLIKEPAVLIHSKLSPFKRYGNMRKWTKGKVRIAVSINILVEGFDLPRLDCIIFARPTLSSTLFLQAVGRVLRTHPNKTHGYIIDLTDNTCRFGTDIDNIKIQAPDTGTERTEKKKDEDMFKICPECGFNCNSEQYECCECGFKWPKMEHISIKTMPKLTDIVFRENVSGLKKHDESWNNIDDWWVEKHTSNKSKKILGKVVYKYQKHSNKTVVMWLCFQDNYRGYAVTQSKKKWEMISKAHFPKTVDDFLESDFEEPYRILIDFSQEYPKIKEIENVPF